MNKTDESFFEAIENLDLQKLKTILEAGYDPNSSFDQYNKTGLETIVTTIYPTEVHFEIASLLIQYKADPNKYFYRPYFHGMCYSSDYFKQDDMVQLLFDNGVDLHFDDDEKRLKLLSCACRGGLYWLVEHMLENGNSLNLREKNPIRDAVQSRRNGIKIIELLLKQGISLEESNSNSTGNVLDNKSLLYLAAAEGSPDVIEYLIRNGLDPLQGDEFAIWGAINGAADTFEALLKYGGEYVKPNYSKIVLHERLAERMCHYPDKERIQVCLDKFKILPKYGYSFQDLVPNEDSSKVCSSILFFVQKRMKLPKYLIDGLVELLKKGLNPTTREKHRYDLSIEELYSFTLLHFACQINSLNFLKACIEFNSEININVRDGDGWTPLHYAAMHKKGNCISFLIENNANLNAESRIEKKIKKITFPKKTTVMDVALEFNSNIHFENS